MGGTGTGGPYPVGGFSYAGSGYAGYPTTGGVVSYGGMPAYGGTPGYGGVSYGGYPVGGTFGYAGTFSTGGSGGSPLECVSCLRDSCAPTLVQCLQDFGCVSIFDCMQSSGCQAFECYSDQYCKATIDQWGGPTGPSMQALLKTFSCAFEAGCECN